MKKKIFLITCIVLSITVFNRVYAQTIKGTVKSKNTSEKTENPLIGANVYWMNTNTGTKTDMNGYFEIQETELSKVLIVSMIGHISDTISIDSYIEELEIILTADNELEEIVVEGDLGDQYHSDISIHVKQVITDFGLTKLPCCNLSESFENNAAVDVNFSDALTGAKQIVMLGLDGKYSQIMRENLPLVRGLSSSYGLTYIPGTWMSSVQISKGTSAVINGYESTTGQINLELKKPEDSERLFFNLYANSEGKFESNLTSAFVLSDKVSTMFLFHGSRLDFTHDPNGDGFADMPLMSQYNAMNRWKFTGAGALEGQIGLRFLQDSREGGQTAYLDNPEDIGFYGIDIETRQYEVFGKLGFAIPGTDHLTVGSVYSISRHEQNSMFGNSNYSGIQNSAYANIIFQTIIQDTRHSLNFGASFVFDDFEEVFNEENFLRTEIVPGIFTQYTFISPEKFSMIAGMRVDFHNLYGTFFTPRLHVKYSVNHHLAFRASAGKGFRTANIFAENQTIFASSRSLIIEDELKQEEAWNYGINASGDIHYGHHKELRWNLDFYRTDFINQIVADINANMNEIRFYNLKGNSYSNSFQAELSLEPIKRFDVSAAFRMNDVHISMNDELIEKPYVNKYKGLLTLSYATKFKKWSIDITNQLNGSSALPDLSQNPEAYHIEKRSPAYYILHVQITKRFKHIEIYAGSENLTNYRQDNLIIDPENPFGNNFDASVIWGPVMGRKIFAGLRINIK